jgi:hypothetical protein
VALWCTYVLARFFFDKILLPGGSDLAAQFLGIVGGLPMLIRMQGNMFLA